MASNPSPSELQIIARPTVIRDRDHILRSIGMVLLSSQVEVLNHPEGSLRHLAEVFLREMQSHGLEVRKSRKVRP
jgi:hypothetical protein